MKYGRHTLGPLVDDGVGTISSTSQHEITILFLYPKERDENVNGKYGTLSPTIMKKNDSLQLRTTTLLDRR